MRIVLMLSAVALCAIGVEAKEAVEQVPVCISAQTTDEAGFRLEGAKDAEDIFKRLGENISKRKSLKVVSNGCAVSVRVLGYTSEATGTTSAVRNNPYNPYAVTGTRQNMQLYVVASVKVGDYETELRATVNSMLFGQGGESAKALSKALERWVEENREAIKKASAAE